MRTKQLSSSVFALCLFAVSQLTLAVVDLYEFENDQLRQRYNVLVEELRCPKCQNQNLAGSDSPIAKDLRRELHRMLQEEQSDDEIKSFMVARYGDYVLYRPQMKSSTYLLWLGPVVLLGLGLLIVIVVLKRQRPAPTTGNSGEAQSDEAQSDAEKVKAILDQAEKDTQ